MSNFLVAKTSLAFLEIHLMMNFWPNFAIIITGFAQMQMWSKVRKAAYTNL